MKSIKITIPSTLTTNLIASILAIIAFGNITNAQSQTFNFEGNVIFDNLDVANLFGFEDTRFGTYNGSFSLDLSATVLSSKGIVGGGARAQYGYDSLTFSLGNQSLSATDFSFNTGKFEGLLITNLAEDRQFDALAISSTEIFSIGSETLTSLVFGVSGTNLINNTDATGINNFINISNSSLTGTFQTSIGGGRLISPTISTVSAIPEPATWLMMIIGFAFTGLATRRRHLKHIDIV
jgi:hypothetical protein